MDADPQVLLKRSENDIVTEEYILFQQEAYRQLAKMLKATQIDTSKYKTNEAFQIIVNSLKRIKNTNQY
jgi:hypothetical protein